jgi:hypothetical protein
LAVALAVAAGGLVGPATPVVPVAAAPPTPGGWTWHVDLASAVADPQSVNLSPPKITGPAVPPGNGLTLASGQRSGLAYPTGITLARPANRFTARMSAEVPAGASVDVAVRGLRPGGWSEWVPLPGVLPGPVRQVGVRLLLNAKDAPPRVHTLTILAGGCSPTPKPGSGCAPAEASPRAEGHAGMQISHVYATREGLVGRHTANGHVIVGNDHFAALSSWRALSPSGKGDYSVRVCAPSTGRCAYVPVWDVGPWNTRDDYWNAPRPQWKGLPIGRPEAQAAYQSGYNAGLDQFGRTVRNPAGLDLADGVVRLDLALKGSAWVNVTFLWTGTGTNAQAYTSGGLLNVRGGAATTAPVIGVVAPPARLPAGCYVHGETIDGSLRTTNHWVRIGPGNYVSYAFVATDSEATIPRCTA